MHWVRDVLSMHLLQLLHSAAEAVCLQPLLALFGLQLSDRLLLLGALVLDLLAGLPHRTQLLLQRRYLLPLRGTEHDVVRDETE